MKFKLFSIVTLAILLSAPNTKAQSIRKNYREMTLAEKNHFCAALDALKANGTIATVAQMHATYFDAVHTSEMFLPWHRYFLADFEQKLRGSGVSGAADICIPYWDWTSQYYPATASVFADNSKNAPLWTDPNFIGKYNSSWNLGRTTTGSDLVLYSTINQVTSQIAFNYTNTNNFAPKLESNLHNPAHMWVMGVMMERASPGDPAFFLNHNMVDKIWSDWNNLGGGRVSSPFYDYGTTTIASKMPFYTSTNPYSLVDSRALKVWYADNNQVALNNYTSSSVENYKYTGTFNVSTFTVPATTNVTMVSGTLIDLKPGFSAKSGSVFHAVINAATFNTARLGKTDLAAAVLPGQASTSNNVLNLNGQTEIAVFPNPSNALFNIALQINSDVNLSYRVINPLGAVVHKIDNVSSKQFAIDLSNQPSGLYFLQLNVNGEMQTVKLFLTN